MENTETIESNVALGANSGMDTTTGTNSGPLGTPDPYKEAEALLEKRNQEIVDAAGKRYQEYMQKIHEEFGVNIGYDTILKIIKT